MFELLLFLGSAFVAAAEQERRGGRFGSRAGPGLTYDQQVMDAQDRFLPYVEGQIHDIQKADPQALSDWQVMAGKLPYLTEAVAMWYVLWDPAVPDMVKMTIAASLLYAISPVDFIPDEIPIIGVMDDAGVLAAALYNAFGYITPEHVEKAKEWLRTHGVEPAPVFALGKKFNEPPAAKSLQPPAVSHQLGKP